MPTELILCPATTKFQQATIYMVLWPHHRTYSILWSMWCSSRRWAIQDVTCDFKPFFQEMFPEGVVVHFKSFKSKQEIEETVRTMNLAQTYNLRWLAEVRSRWALPPWAPEGDEYRYIDYSRGVVK